MIPRRWPVHADGGPVTQIHHGPGQLARLAEVLAAASANRVLVVAAGTALHHSGVKDYLHRRLPTGLGLTMFSGFTPNPRFADVVGGCDGASAADVDAIVGVGGGSAMDVAKMIRAWRGRSTEWIEASLRGEWPAPDAAARVPLILIPTVAGSGSEVTRFATVYRDGRKYSLDHPLVRADVAIVDADLAASCPYEVTASGALDAFAHAVESLWSVRADERSQALAAQALHMVSTAVADPAALTDTRARRQLAQAATLAGTAIDLTRTTAGHGFAYPLTIGFGVPHGVACALSLSWLIPLTVSTLRPATARLLADGAGVPTADDLSDWLGHVLDGFGLARNLSAYGVTVDALPELAAAGRDNARSTNHPVPVDDATAVAGMRAILDPARADASPATRLGICR